MIPSLLPFIATAVMQAQEAVIVDRISHSLPAGWYVANNHFHERPYWSFSKDHAYRVTLVGPTKTGRSYFRSDGSFISTELFQREAIIIWIGLNQFDPKLTVINRLLSKFPEVPTRVDAGEIKLYLKEGCFSLPSPFEKTSPKETHLSLPVAFKSSWPDYLEDIKKTFETPTPHSVPIDK